MPAPQVPKYQAIYANLRQQILGGEFAPGERLPPQQELADEFGVTLMTLRQAVAALESDGLVWAARGKGTFVADRPVDISVGNLSSFAQQMASAGITMETEQLGIVTVGAADNSDAALSLGLDGGSEAGGLLRLTRRRTVRGVPISLQRSYLTPGLIPADSADDLADASLYETIEASTGWIVAEARESITAVGLSASDAELLDAAEAQPAILSIRTSVNQFDRPFLYDEALLVGGRCVITADRTSDRLSLSYGVETG